MRAKSERKQKLESKNKPSTNNSRKQYTKTLGKMRKDPTRTISKSLFCHFWKMLWPHILTFAQMKLSVISKPKMESKCEGWWIVPLLQQTNESVFAFACWMCLQFSFRLQIIQKDNNCTFNSYTSCVSCVPQNNSRFAWFFGHYRLDKVWQCFSNGNPEIRINVTKPGQEKKIYCKCRIKWMDNE